MISFPNIRLPQPVLKTLRKSRCCIRCGLPTHASSYYKATSTCQRPPPVVRSDRILELSTELLEIALEDYIRDQPVLVQHYPTRPLTAPPNDIADHTRDIIQKVIISRQQSKITFWHHAALFMDSRVAEIYSRTVQKHMLHVFDIDCLLLADSATILV